MRTVKTQRDFEELRDAIAVRTAGGWMLYEGASRLAALAPEAVEISGGAREPVLRVGDAGRMWRVVAWEERGGELRIQVRGAFGRAGATVRVARDGEGPLAWGPDWFEEAVCRALESSYGVDAASLARRGDRLAGSVRVAPGRRAAVVALPPGGDARQADDLLAAGLVARARIERAQGRAADLLVFSAPPTLGVFAERLAWLTPRAAVRLFDVTGRAVEVRPHDQGSLAGDARVIWPRPEPPPSALVDRIVAIEPDVLRRHRRAGERADRVVLRGLECARVHAGPVERATFGLGRSRERLDDASWPRLEALVRRLAWLRSPDPPDRTHPAYRLYPERWLAALLSEDVAAIDPVLDPTFVYEQVPAWRRESRDFVDLLAVTRSGRLAVVEIKAAEDRALPLQGLNYWSRVRWYHARGEISRRGYFPGVALDPRPPLLYLVAPLFRFHASVKVALGLFSPEVEAVAVGLNSDWRSRPRALVRTPTNHTNDHEHS